MTHSTCHHCKRKFTPQRTTAKFCSARCRVAYSRVTQNVRKRAAKQTLALINELRETVARYPELRDEVVTIARDSMRELLELARGGAIGGENAP